MTAMEARRRPPFKGWSKISVDEGRRSREETSVQLRKSKKDDLMLKRRGMVGTLTTTTMTTTTTTMTMQPATNDMSTLVPLVESSSAIVTTGSDTEIDLIATTATEETIRELVGTYRKWSQDQDSVAVTELHETTKEFRRMLAKGEDRAVRQVIQAGVIPFLVLMLGQLSEPDLIFEAEWALTNVASTSFTAVVANEPGAVQQLAKLLLFHEPNVREQAAWCLGNIAGDSIQFRDGVLATPGVIDGMVKNLENIANESMLQNMTWACSSMIRGKPAPPLNLIRPFLSAMAKILHICQAKKTAPNLRGDTVWAFSYVTEAGDDYVQAALDCGMLPPLMSLVREFLQERDLLVPTVRAIGNVVAGTDDMTEMVLREGLMDYVLPLLEHQSKSVKKDMCWMLSNVAAGTAQQCERILLAGHDYKLVKVLAYIGLNASHDIRKEAIYAVCNLVINLSVVNLHKLVDRLGMKVIRVMVHAMCLQGETKLLMVVLEALERMFQEREEDGTIKFDELGGLEQLEDLQNHQNNDIYETAVHLIVQYFGGQDEQDLDQNIAPALQDDSFSFGLPSKQLFPDGHGSPMPTTYEFGEFQSPSTFSNIGEIFQV